MVANCNRVSYGYGLYMVCRIAEMKQKNDAVYALLCRNPKSICTYICPYMPPRLFFRNLQARILYLLFFFFFRQEETWMANIVI